MSAGEETRSLFGTFRLDVTTGLWTWSDAVFAIYGFDVGEVVPNLELMAAHQHPDDRARWLTDFDRLVTVGEPFCRRFRIIDARRKVRTVMAIGNSDRDDSGAVVEVSGFLVDLTQTLREHRAEEFTRAVVQSAATRSVIDQAKGVMMASFDLTDQQAFDLLRVHSSYANVKLRYVAATLVERLAAPELVGVPLRQRAASILGALADGRVPDFPRPENDLPNPQSAENAGQTPAEQTLAEQTLAATGRIPATDLPRTLIRAIAGAAQSISIADALTADHPLVYVNAAFVALTGYRAEQILGRNCRFLQGADTDRAQVESMRIALAQGQEVRTVVRNYRRDGRPFWNELHLSAVRDETGRLTHYIGYQVDASERVEREQQLFRLAYYDARTGLPNQARALAHIESSISAAVATDVLYIRVGGIDTADRMDDDSVVASVLATTGLRLRSELPRDVFVAELDGNAFLVAQADGDLQGTVNAIRVALADPIPTPRGEARVAVSVGRSRCPRDGNQARALIALAESNATAIS